MESDEAFGVVDRAVFEYKNEHLTDLQKEVFLRTWKGQTYTQMQNELGYSDYISQGIGPDLWKLLSAVLGETVGKTNFRAALERRKELQQIKEFSPPNSEFYVERPPIESLCYKAIGKPGALLRIKAPQQMGKTWLTRKVLQVARKGGYKTLTLSFEEADRTVFTNLQRFSKWFCGAVSKRLGLAEQLNNYWKDDALACNFNTTTYFQDYLLAESTQSLVLALNKVDLVFEHYEIADDFCKLLRSWHDHAQRGEWYSERWQKLHLVIVHATDIYSSLDINCSPLAGAGVVVDLPDFTSEQVQELAQQYSLTWDDTETNKLMNLVGGHPYLVSLPLAEIMYKDATLDHLLQKAHTEEGIYRDHLLVHLVNLNRNPELKKAFREVVITDKPVELSPMDAFKLQSIGLVKREGNCVKLRCDLYRKYFRERLDN